MEAVETRVAVIAIIVREGAQVAALNELLIAKKRLGGWFSKGIIVTFSTSTGPISSAAWACPTGKRA